MIRAERDPEFINRIVNSPAVRPFMGRPGEVLDLSPAVGRSTQTGIVWLSNGEDALAAFPQTGDREYEGHLFFTETCRGRKALDAGKEMLDWLARYADSVWGSVPSVHRAALWYVRALGFVHDGDGETLDHRSAVFVRKVLH